MIGMIAAPILGGVIGNLMSAGKQAEANQLMQQQLDTIRNLQVPEERALALEQLKSVGVLTPEMEQTYLQDDSELADIQTNPEFEKAQMTALNKLQEIGSEGGLTATDKAKLYEVQQAQDTQTRGAREAIMQNQQARGLGGSGQALAAQLMAQQGAAQMGAQRGMDVAAMAEQRALDAIMGAGDLGGQMQSTSFNQQATQKSAQDAINRFNTSMMSDTAQRNIAAKNNAQQANLANAQNISNQNVGIMNQANQYNQQAGQRTFQNKLAKATGSNAPANALAGNLQQQGQQKAQMYSGIGTGIGQGLGAYQASNQNSDLIKYLKDKKEQEEIDASGM